MAAAVEKRDNAIIAAVGVYSSTMTTALTTRRDALKAAWQIADNAQREAALKAAHNAFKGTWKKARQAMNDARKAAWKTFRQEAKTNCKVNVTGSESSLESSDNQI